MSVARVTRKQCDCIFSAIYGLPFVVKKYLRFVHHKFDSELLVPGLYINIDIGSSEKVTLDLFLVDLRLAAEF